MHNHRTASGADLDVLIVGAGPTGLVLASQLERFGVRFRIIDKMHDRSRESRALGVQARSLEVLQSLGLGEALACRGRTAVQIMVHIDGGDAVAGTLSDITRKDTRFPFVLFVSQAETESVLTKHLASRGVIIERGVELVNFLEQRDCVSATLQHTDGRAESIRAIYLAGCDGAHSAVRKGAGIPFEGGAYRQSFVLGDVEADGVAPRDAIHAFGMGRGFAIFFPLGSPTTWRIMAMEPNQLARDVGSNDGDISTQPLSLDELQAIVNEPTGDAVHLRDAAWLTRFRLHHRQAARYRKGRVFLAGDAAHIHSPVGAQGMNTGIQDAWNLGWKLALVARGHADERLLDTYEAERWPVGRTLLRATDRAFGAFTRSVSGGRILLWLRRVIVRLVVARALSQARVRTFVFGFVSQLGIRYRASPAVHEGDPPLRGGPRAGDRLPDARLWRADTMTFLQQALDGPYLHLLLCGPVDAWDEAALSALMQRFHHLLSITFVTRTDETPEALVDRNGEAFARLGVKTSGQYVIRPDGHVAFRCAGVDLRSARDFLERWYRRA